jgi:hypothetical protein
MYLRALQHGGKIVHTITLLDPPTSPSPSWDIVTAKLRELEEQKARVYRTFCECESETYSFVFVTTSKDTHLGFGCLDKLGLEHLGLLLIAEDEEILMKKDETGKSCWLVNRRQDDNKVFFTFSPAH